jgi:hypothetical protein
VKLNKRVVFSLLIGVVGASLLAVALAAGRPQTHGLQGHTTLLYRKPFIRCVGADGARYRQVLNWVGTGTARSNDARLNGQRIVDNVDFFQNLNTGVGVVEGTLKTLNRSRHITGTGTLTAVWHGDNGEGQVVIHPVGTRSALRVFILNVELHLRSVSNGIAVDIVFGMPPSPTAPENASAFFNGKKC